MRSAILLSLCLCLSAACGDNDKSGLADAGGPDARIPPAACADPEPGIICTVAGSGGYGYSGDDGPALAAEFSLPQDVLVDPAGGLLILDWNNHRVRKLMGDGSIIHIAGRGELGGDLDDPAGQDFNHPTNLLLDPDTGDFLIAAWHNSKIRRLDTSTGEVTDLAGDGRRAYFGDDEPALNASFDLPAAVAWDPDGNLVIMDQANQTIRMVDSEGVVHKLAGNCIVDGPPPGPGTCDEPVDCPVDMLTGFASGKKACMGTSFCAQPCTPRFATGTAATLRMAQPFGQSADPAGRMAFDADGNLLWVDTENSLLRKLDGEGNDTIVAGLPPVEGVQQKGYSGDGGPADQAMLNRPVDIAIDEDGTIYLTDVFNDCVRAIDPDGVIDTVVGTCGERGYEGDGGAASEALLKLPYGIELAGDTLFIVDTGNSVIRAVRLR